MKEYFTVIGAGMFGCAFARCMAEQGKEVIIVDKRNHIGGNCYTENIKGINVHKYGPHCFHTNNKAVWDFVNRFAEFNSFQLRVKVKFKNRIYSFPVNMMTLHQMWGVETPKQAEEELKRKRIPSNGKNDLESWILSQVGSEIYETFIKGYTTKQWGRDPKLLPNFIIRRLPIRMTYDERHFNDKYQGIPVGGYTKMFENMLDHKNIKLSLNVDFFENKKELSEYNLVYTGKVDEFYDYQFGELEYRSLRFETFEEQGDQQGTAVVNYTEKQIPFTRIVEHKHFEFKTCEHTILTKEYPDKYEIGKTPYYPIKDNKNSFLYEKYKKLNDGKVLFRGRLGTFNYYDMHQVVASAMNEANKFKS